MSFHRKPLSPIAHACAADDIEMETALETLGRLDDLRRLVGNVGVSDPETSTELDSHLAAALAAAGRWVLEAQLSRKSGDRRC